MKISQPGFVKVAIINPKKEYGEKDQYRSFPASFKNLSGVLNLAKKNFFEIRHDYYDIKADKERLPYRVIITEIPPGHVQPFHLHKNLHEMTIVTEGEIFYIESESFSESEKNKLVFKKKGKKMKTGDLVVDDKGKRHTVANFSKKYAKMITIQSARKNVDIVSADWIR